MDAFLDHLERDHGVITNGTAYAFILQEVMKPLVLRLRDAEARWACLLEQRIAVKQLALHIDTWYTLRGVGKEQA